MPTCSAFSSRTTPYCRPSGAPRRAFLAGCLADLSESMGGRLLIVHGRPARVIPQVAAAVGAGAVHVSADYGPYGHQRDERRREVAAGQGIDFVATGSPYAVAPGRVRKPDGGRYSVFTPYYRGWTSHGWRQPAGGGKAPPYGGSTRRTSTARFGTILPNSGGRSRRR